MITSRLRSDKGLGRRVRRALGMLVGLLAVSTLGLAACGGDEATPCEGVTVNGECQQKCSEAVCSAQGMKCVGNSCGQTCPDPVKDLSLIHILTLPTNREV